MNVLQRLESLPMTPTMRKILFLVGIGWMFDAMDQGIISGVIASIGNDWSLTAFDKAFLTSGGMLGMIFGAALSGSASDRFGRRTVVTVTLLIFSVGSFASGMAPNYAMLLVCRFITGFGLGGELPAASTLVSEYSPIKQRGRNVILLESFWAWGWILMALVSYLVIPIWGWRIAFFIGAIPALFAAGMRFAVPESPRYLELRGRHGEADALVSKMEAEAGIIATSVSSATSTSGDSGNSNAGKLRTLHSDISTASASSCSDNPIRFNRSNSANGSDIVSDKNGLSPSQSGMLEALFKLFDQANLRSTITLWVLWFAINFGYYGFVLWTPSLLQAQGYDMVKSFEFTLIMCVAQLPGYFAAALLIERIGRKKVLVLFLLGTAASAWFFGQANSTELVLASGCLLYFFALGAWGCVYSYTPELYPTEIRGTGNGWAAAFGRVGALIGPFVVPWLYAGFGEQQGFVYIFVILMAVFAIAAVVVAVLGRETKGLVVGERSEANYRS